jgi:hypothetical protein
VRVGLRPVGSWVFTDQERREEPRVSGYAGGGVFARAREAFAEAEGWLSGPGAAGLGHAALEKGIAARGREIQRLLLQDHLSALAAAEPRLARVTGPDGVVRTQAERGRARALASIFGPVTVSRIAYRAAGVPAVHPLDAELGLPPGRHSHGLAEMTAAEVVRVALEPGCVQVRARTGCRLGTRQAQQLARVAACDFDGFYASRPAPLAVAGEVVVLSCDAKGIRMRPGELRPRAARQAAAAVPQQDGRLSQGEVRTRRRMAAVGAVWVITPAPRTTADILGPDPRAEGPGTRRKWLTASIAEDAAGVIAAVFAEADRRDPGHERPWIALADGNKDQIAQIKAQAAARGITVTVICDLIHVTEYLWDATWCFHPRASRDAGGWVRDRTAQILDGGPAGAAAVAAALRDAAAGLGKTRRTTAEKTAGYLQAKAPYLDYPAALAAGWPIATGVIEGACRHLVKDRMDITGARWGVATAEAILKLRAIWANGDWDDYWTWHLQQEHQRNHPGYTLAA